MRFADVVLRGGHLSDQAIAESIMTGERPVHLDQCDICAGRSIDLGRWLDAVRTTAIDAADAEFSPERLAAQHAQIQRRLAQLDEPTRVLAFPGQARLGGRESGRLRVAPAWIGVAAAAGLVIGAIGGQAAARFDRAPTASAATATPSAAQPAPAAEPQNFTATNASLLDVENPDAYLPDSLGALNDITPRMMQIAVNVRR
jgi:hypothetical protein